jgi:PIN domain nuclease of toxin-antitoxin system
MAGEKGRLGEKARGAIERGDPVLVSAVVLWEVAIKRLLGKLDAPPNLFDQLLGAGVELLPISPRHADRVGTLPFHHRDPFDRLLVAQADCDGLALVTADPDLRDYGIEVVW